MAKFILSLIGLLLCHFANTRTLRNDYNFQETVIQAISDISGDALRKYLANNNEAFIRLGGKLEALAEKLLDKQVQAIESNLSNIFLETKELENYTVPTSKPPQTHFPASEPNTVKLTSPPIPELPASTPGPVRQPASESTVTAEPVPAPKSGSLPKPLRQLDHAPLPKLEQPRVPEATSAPEPATTIEPSETTTEPSLGSEPADPEAEPRISRKNKRIMFERR